MVNFCFCSFGPFSASPLISVSSFSASTFISSPSSSSWFFFSGYSSSLLPFLFSSEICFTFSLCSSSLAGLDSSELLGCFEESSSSNEISCSRDSTSYSAWWLLFLFMFLLCSMFCTILVSCSSASSISYRFSKWLNCSSSSSFFIGYYSFLIIIASAILTQLLRMSAATKGNL